MSVPTAAYPLPGVGIDIADLGLRISAPLPGPKLTLFGITTAVFDGKDRVNDPMEVASFPAAIQATKNADGTDSELSRAIEQAQEAGAKRVEFVVIAQTSNFATVNDRWDALAESYKQLKDYTLDHVHPVNAYADATGLTSTDPNGETRTTFWNQLANFCHRATKVGNTVRGYIGITPLMQLAKDENWSVKPTTDAEVLFEYPTIAQINEYADHVEGIAGTLKDHSAETVLDGYTEGSVEQAPGVISTAYTGWAKDENGNIDVDAKNQNVDGGRYITVVGIVARQVLPSTPTRAAVNDYGGEFSENTNGAVAVAAKASTLQPHQSLTNKPIQSLIPPRSIPTGFSTRMLNARVLTMATRSNGFVVVKGITGAHNAGPYTKSDYTLWTTFNTVIVALDLAKDKAYPYLGQQSSADIMAALNNDVNAALHALTQWGLAKRVVANVIQTRDQQILSELDIELNITPTGEITNILFRAQLHKD